MFRLRHSHHQAYSNSRTSAVCCSFSISLSHTHLTAMSLLHRLLCSLLRLSYFSYCVGRHTFIHAYTSSTWTFGLCVYILQFFVRISVDCVLIHLTVYFVDPPTCSNIWGLLFLTTNNGSWACHLHQNDRFDEQYWVTTVIRTSFF
jgi:hypothetical protein